METKVSSLRAISVSRLGAAMPFLADFDHHSFTPDRLEIMRAAFVATLRALGLVERDDPIVRRVAKTIVEVASAGESDAEASRDRALKQLAFFEAEQAAMAALLRDAIAIAGADLGNIQSYAAADKSLAIIVQQGFKDDFLRMFERVSLADGSACARAMRAKLPIFIPDVSIDADFAVYRAVAERAGFAAVLSVPLITDSTQFVGILSVHFARPQAPNLIKMDLLSEYARHAANALAGTLAAPCDSIGRP
jgi:GAF domain-containing protein